MIELKGVSLSFGQGAAQVHALRDVSFSLRPQERVALLGPSGSGKSTCLKILAGLLKPTHGTASVHGDRVGLLFQQNALFDSWTSLENLTFTLEKMRGIKNKGSKKDILEEAHALLGSVGLQHAAEQFPSQLSGGMQKRLGIARLLASNPNILLVDEPTAGLDPVTSKQIAVLIDTYVTKRKATLLVVTTETARAHQLAERMLLLSQGVLVADESTRGHQPVQNAWLAQFLSGSLQGPLSSEFGG